MIFKTKYSYYANLMVYFINELGHSDRHGRIGDHFVHYGSRIINSGAINTI